MFTQETPIVNTLFCEDESLDEVLGSGFDQEESTDLYLETHEKKQSSLLEIDLFWEDDELVCLLSKEKESHLCFNNGVGVGFGDLMVFRKDDVLWMGNVTSYHGFRAITLVLGVSYYDRFISLQNDKPCISRLAAIACLSIAAKVEETHVPLLFDLQAPDAECVFEAKSIQRMELLVLCTLGWKMNLVTPFSFLDHIFRKFNLNTNLNREFLTSFKNVIMCIINDSMFLHYLPSVIAAASWKFVCNDFEHSELRNVLKLSKDKVEECYKLIVKLMVGHIMDCKNLKRKYQSVPGSPIGVIGAYFSSCESCNDSWAVASSPPIPSSSTTLFKRNQVQDLANDAIA